MTSRPFAALALGLLLLPPPALRAAGPPAAESFSESIQVSVVNLDVFVTDAAGKPVPGLRQEDFTVLEDGKPVEVSNFSAESGRPGAAVPATVVAGSAPAAASQAPADQRLRLVVFVDDVNLSAANRSRVLQSAGRFLHTELKPGDQVMLVRYDEKLEVRQPFTSDLARLDADLAALLALPTDVRKYSLSLGQVREELAQAVEDGEGLGSPTAEAAMSNWAAQESSAVRGALNALDSLVISLAGVPGRKAVLYVSDGLPLVPGLDIFTNYSRVADRPTNHSWNTSAQRFDLTRRFREVAAHASRDRIVLYPIEAYGTRTTTSSLIGSVALENRQNGLRLLAEETGGRPLLNAANVPEALARMGEDFSAYYSLGYQPQRAGDAAEHRIEVRVRARGIAQVRYRRWSRDKPVREAIAERTLAAMRFGAEENPLAASVEVVPGRKAGESLLRVRVPLARLYLEPQGESRQGHLRFYVAAGGGGRSTAVRETRPATVNVAEAEAATGKLYDYTHDIALSLPPGSYALGLAVRDEKGAVISYLHKDFAVAAAPGAAKR